MQNAIISAKRRLDCGILRFLKQPKDLVVKFFKPPSGKLFEVEKLLV